MTSETVSIPPTIVSPPTELPTVVTSPGTPNSVTSPPENNSVPVSPPMVTPPTSHAAALLVIHVTPPSVSHASVGSGATTRLPKLSIPVFSGDPLQWQSFWDCFEAAVHNNPSLTNAQKLNYLLTQLQHDAARVVAGFPLTGVNYEHSVTLLRQRYGQTHKLVIAHMNALVEMCNPTNSSSALQFFYDSVESHVQSLSSLGQPRESYGPLLVPIILSKLPADVKRNMARQHGNDDWTIDELQDSLLTEIRIFEAGSHHLFKNQHNPITASFHASTVRKPSRTTSDS